MSSVVMAMCPVCKKLTPHKTVGVEADRPAEQDESGDRFQRMECCECSTSSKVYSGEEGEKFQENYDFPDNTTLPEDE